MEGCIATQTDFSSPVVWIDTGIVGDYPLEGIIRVGQYLIDEKLFIPIGENGQLIDGNYRG